MRSSRASSAPQPRSARTVRFPPALKQRITVDAERCGRSFEAQVLAILRRHYGEDVDIAPAPDAIIALALESFAGIPEADRRQIARRIGEEEAG